MYPVSKHVRHGVVIYLFQFHIQSAFSRQITVGAITALTFHKLKQITIKEESLGVQKTCCIARFPCDSTVFLYVIEGANIHVDSAKARLKIDLATGTRRHIMLQFAEVCIIEPLWSYNTTDVVDHSQYKKLSCRQDSRPYCSTFWGHVRSSVT